MYSTKPSTQDHIRECVACDMHILKAMEENPIVRQLQDKLERLHYQLMEAKNQNQMLRRDLLVARKVLCQEVGGNAMDFSTILRQGTEQGWKGRQEMISVLKSKMRDMQEKILELDPDGKFGGKLSPKKESPFNEYTKEDMKNDRKLYWRMELERRQVHERAEKELNVLVEDASDLRRKLEISRCRNKDLTDENRILRSEVNTLIEKNREDVGLIDSLHNVESQLKDTLDDRSEIRHILETTRVRNKRLCEDLQLVRDQNAVLRDKTQDDATLISALTNQQKHMQSMLEREQMLGHQSAERYKEELKQMQMNHATNSSILQQLQETLAQKEIIIKKLEEELMSDAALLQEPTEEVVEEDVVEEAGEEGEEGEEEGKEPHVTASQESKSGSDKSGSGSSKSGKEDEDLAWKKEIVLECAKFKTLFESGQKECFQLSAMINTLNGRVDELTVQVIETQRMCLDKELENQELKDTFKRYQGILKGKKKRGKLWEKLGKPLTLPRQDPIDELNIRMNVLVQENNFLRTFLETAIASKEEDFQLYKTITDETKKMFLCSLKAIKSQINLLDSKGKEQEEGEGDGEDEEAASE